MRILGVDPGSLITGYGVIDVVPRGFELVDAGIIRTGGERELARRLRTIHIDLLEVIEETDPDCFAIESAFYSRNVQSTLKLGHARGAALLAAALNDLPTAEYAPREIKQSVVGRGNASKEQVSYMVCRMLRISGNLPLDASDALGVAICHGLRGLQVRG